ncbi:alkaline phosphatase, partial [Magnaporthiopsis poae ATCC 64411]
AQVREVLEYDRTFKAVLDFIDASDTESVLVATSDHETGGLSTAVQEPGHLPVYAWYPEALKRASASAEQLVRLLNRHLAAADETARRRENLRQWINGTLVRGGLGITNAADSELDQLVAHPEDALVIFSQMISLRAHVGWATHGHSAVDVNVYSSGGPGTEKIRGNVENTDIGRFLAEYLDVQDGVKEVTKELKESRTAGGPQTQQQSVGAEPAGYEAAGHPLDWVSATEP